MRILALLTVSFLALAAPAGAQDAPSPADTVTVPAATPVASPDTVRTASPAAPSDAADPEAFMRACRGSMLAGTSAGVVLGAVAGAIVAALPAAALSVLQFHPAARAVLWISTAVGGAVMGTFGLTVGVISCAPG